MGAAQHSAQKSLCQELCEPLGPPEGLLLPGLPQLLLFPP